MADENQENQENKEKIPYIPISDFSNSEYNPYPICKEGVTGKIIPRIIPRVAGMESIWYQTIIQPSIRNKSRLISNNPDEAMTIFSRYDDVQGLEMIAGNTNLSEKLRKIADNQIESVERDKFKYSQEKYILVIRGKQTHSGRDPLIADLLYHGEGYRG